MLDTLTNILSNEQVRQSAQSVFPLTARGLVFETAGKRLIDGIDLTLHSGQRTVIMGPNGAGKTMLLRLLHGLLQPTRGEVRWHGDLADEAIAQRQAMVFQRPVLLRRSVASNIRYAMAAARVPRAERESRLTHWLREANLEQLARRPARLLSGGEQQRLAIARALTIKPEILFMDEPTASLDPASVLGVEKLVQQAHEAGTKIVLVTHDLGQARRLADEVVLINHGRVQEHTNAEDFFQQPQSEAGAAYVQGRIVM